jgi:tubulin polyglutamylase TTLL4
VFVVITNTTTQQIKADKSIFIIKPNASSCGRGIRLIHKDNIATVDKKKSAVVQKYLEKPHLING